MDSAETIPILDDRRILLGVTGSIAAYKAADLASKLTQAGARVDVILTQAAQRFVTPLTFQSVTGRRAYTDDDLWGSEAHVIHVGLSQETALLLIAPATANTIAKLAHGLADNLLTLTALALSAPLAIAPAMDAGMYQNPATKANLEILQQRGVDLLGPAQGRMASGLIGTGRMVEPQELIGHIRRILGREGQLAGRKVVVTAGGTREPIDPVRVVANRSSGKQGYALAQAAVDRGAQTLLICTPTDLTPPFGAERIEVETADEMCQAVMGSVSDADVLLMAAAVADFRPTHQAGEKIKRHKGVPELELEPTDDILALVTAQRDKSETPRMVVGFAAESRDLVENARAKMKKKGLDLIVANDITSTDAGFGANTNRVTLISADDDVEELPLMRKSDVAEKVLDKVVDFLSQQT